MSKLINCDIGERGHDNKDDNELVKLVDIVNIACGGHAGDYDSIAWYTELAKKYNKQITAHISYPDKENFGRVSMDIGSNELINTLDTQLAFIKQASRSTISAVKFHGALYNDSLRDANLAGLLACWLYEQNITLVITDIDGELGKACRGLNIKVLHEFFAERNYILVSGKAKLAPRSLPFASIKDIEVAMDHCTSYITNSSILLYTNAVLTWETTQYTFTPREDETICIHSDSNIAIELATRLSSFIKSAY